MRRLGKVMTLMVSLVTIVMLASFFAPTVKAATTVTINVTYCQTEARGMRDLINKWRATGPEYRTPDGGVLNSPYAFKLNYDYNLEKLAMQRAAELVVKYSHERPDGSSALDGYTVNGENIAWGYETAEDVFLAWCEEDDPYEDQGHRRNMLGCVYDPNNNPWPESQTFTAIGIGCVEYNGIKYWVQEFAIDTVNQTEVPANDSLTAVSISYTDSNVSTSYSAVVDAENPLLSYAYLGDVYTLPDVHVFQNLGKYHLTDLTDDAVITWTSSNPTVASISGNDIVYLSTGSTTIRGTATIAGQTVTIQYSPTYLVQKRYMSNATVADLGTGVSYTIDNIDVSRYYPDQEYTGRAITPDFEVSFGDKQLVEGVDYSVTYYNNIRVTGEDNYAYAVITSLRDIYSGSKYVYFNIVPADISNADVTGITDKPYTGSAVTQSPVVEVNGTRLTETSYTVSYTDNVNVGTVTMTITGRGNYTGTYEETFEILPLDISEATIADIEDVTYTGEAFTPSPVVKYGDTTLVEDEDYTVSYYDNTEAGTASIIVWGIGNYDGRIETEFEILPANISEAVIDLSESTFTYSGYDITPDFSVKVDGTTLSDFDDYTYEFSDNFNAGTGLLTVTGIGNYTGTATATITIEPAVLVSEDIYIDEDTFAYTGEEILPYVNLGHGGWHLYEDFDYIISVGNNINVGEAVITVEGIGNYTGTVEKKFTINPADISDADVYLSENSFTYTGEELIPEVTVEFGNSELVGNEDFIFTIDDSVNVGTATVTVTGIGNFTGTITTTYEITPIDILDTSITEPDDVTYTGESMTPGLVITYGETTLVEDVDYSLEYSDNADVGMVTISVTGLGNFYGTIESTFEILPAYITDAVITLSGTEFTYSGSSYSPIFSIKLNGVTLMNLTDYSYEFRDNVEAGTATLYVYGENNYTGTATAEFTIVPAQLTEEDVVLSDIPDTYTGDELIPEISVSHNEIDLEEGTDYIVEIENNVNAGVATVTVTGNGNYSGTVENTFTINPVDISDLEIVVGEEDLIYTGAELYPDIEISFGEIILEEGEDYIVTTEDSINAGNGTVYITMQSNFTGTADYGYEIKPANFEDVLIYCNANYEYTGEEIKPEPIVALNDRTLEEGVDYELTYENNTDIGTGKITITPISDNFQGSAVFTFNITPINLSRATVTFTSECIYDGTRHQPSLVVTMGDTVLENGVDYKIIGYYDNRDAGEGTVNIQGIGNYTSIIAADFTIAPAVLNGVGHPDIPDYTFNGNPFTLGEIFFIGDVHLVLGEDYLASYTNNINAGTATLTLRGINNYTGSVDVNYTINPCDISSATVSLGSEYIYTGSAVTPAPTVVLGTTTLVSGTDYIVEYSSNVQVGTATITITGKGNYIGTIESTFSIVEPPVVTPEVTPTVTPTVVPTVRPTTRPTVAPTTVPTTAPTVAPTNRPANPTQAPTPAPESGVGGFVERLYTIALNRPSDPNGKADWVNRVYTAGATGADIAQGFLFSPEFLGKDMSNEEFLDVLYRVFFDRPGDQGGVNYWLGQMAGGMDKETVIWGFINSTEWANVCLRFGIASGGNGVANIQVEPSQGIIEFATRLYTTCLGREADQVGLMDWARQLANRQISGSQAAAGFFTSGEFVSANYSNEEYINRLYLTFMGRPADQGGFDYWMSSIAQGASREDVFNGFAGSAEWAEICSSYGILK